MPRQKDLKRIVRSRMQKTGESYTSARAQVLRKPPPDERQERPQTLDYAGLAGRKDDTIAAKTGRTWAQWVDELDRCGAAELPHREIAALVNQSYGVDGWWSQAVTVGYERIKGRREPGQRADGAFEASKSRTYNVPVRVLFRAWAEPVQRRRWLTDVSSTIRSASEPQAIRLQWPDGSIVAAWLSERGPSRSNVALAHQKLPDRAAVERVKMEWSVRLDALGKILDRDADGFTPA